MSGERFFLDTNAIVALLRGDEKVLEMVGKAEWIGISIVSYLEFLSFSGLSREDEANFERFIDRIEVTGLNLEDSEILEAVLRFRMKDRLKLPDAIIGGTTAALAAVLVTADKEFEKSDELKVRWI